MIIISLIADIMIRECDEAGEYLKYVLRITEVIYNQSF